MTPIEHSMKIEHIAQRASGYGMPGIRVDGNDPLAVLAALNDAVQRARHGEGPTLLECVTFRFRGHYFGDPQAYIPAEQLAAAQAADPLPTFRKRLLDENTCTESELAQIEADAQAAVEDALATVLASPPPALDVLDRDVYANAANCPA